MILNSVRHRCSAGLSNGGPVGRCKWVTIRMYCNIVFRILVALFRGLCRGIAGHTLTVRAMNKFSCCAAIDVAAGIVLTACVAARETWFALERTETTPRCGAYWVFILIMTLHVSAVTIRSMNCHKVHPHFVSSFGAFARMIFMSKFTTTATVSSGRLRLWFVVVGVAFSASLAERHVRIKRVPKHVIVINVGDLFVSFRSGLATWHPLLGVLVTRIAIFCGGVVGVGYLQLVLLLPFLSPLLLASMVPVGRLAAVVLVVLIVMVSTIVTMLLVLVVILWGPCGISILF